MKNSSVPNKCNQEFITLYKSLLTSREKIKIITTKQYLLK